MRSAIDSRKWVRAWAGIAILTSTVPHCRTGAEEDAVGFGRERTSREISLSVGNEETPLGKELVSREASMFIEAGSEGALASREATVVVGTGIAPKPIERFQGSFSPTGDALSLNWTSYIEWAEKDMDHYEVYVSDRPITNISAIQPYIARAGTLSMTVTGLKPWQDRFVAIVPVSAAGLGDYTVTPKGFYVLQPEATSRELTLYHEGTDRGVASREASLVISDQRPPSKISTLNVKPSATGDQVAVSWNGYNEWTERDVHHYEVYVSEKPFDTVSSPILNKSVQAGSFETLIEGLTPWKDRFIAVVAVDASGTRDPVVKYRGAYVLQGQVTSREATLYLENGSADQKSVASRELTFLHVDDTIPEPIATRLDSSIYDTVTSTNRFAAMDISWPGYNEYRQRDVQKYRIYWNREVFSDVNALQNFAEIPANRSAYTLTGLDSRLKYYVAVVAVDGLDRFDPKVTPRSAVPSVFEVGDVLNLTFDRGSHQLTAKWEKPMGTDPFLVGYRVYFNGRQPDTLTADALSWSINGLNRGENYRFQLSTVDKFGLESPGIDTSVSTLDKLRPVIAWDDPSPIDFGTALGPEQLDAAADVQGNFTYVPDAGVILPVGPDQTLLAIFTPADTDEYAAVERRVLITVRSGGETLLKIGRTAAGDVVAFWESNVGTKYVIETTADLESPVWEKHSEADGTGQLMQQRVGVQPSALRFFRLKLLSH